MKTNLEWINQRWKSWLESDIGRKIVGTGRVKEHPEHISKIFAAFCMDALAEAREEVQTPAESCKSAESFADDLWDDLNLLHLNIEMTRGDWIKAIAPALMKFAEGEIVRRKNQMVPAGIGDYVHSKPGCPFMYCDQEAPYTACLEKCRHATESQH